MLYEDGARRIEQKEKKNGPRIAEGDDGDRPRNEERPSLGWAAVHGIENISTHGNEESRIEERGRRRRGGEGEEQKQNRRDARGLKKKNSQFLATRFRPARELSRTPPLSFSLSHRSTNPCGCDNRREPRGRYLPVKYPDDIPRGQSIHTLWR